MQNILLGSCSRILKAKRDLRIQPNNFTDMETKAHRENILVQVAVTSRLKPPDNAAWTTGI